MNLLTKLHSTSSAPAAGRAASALFGVALAAVCVIAPNRRADAAAPGLSVTHSWMRFIIPARPAAGYFTLSNSSNTAEQLVGASSPACGMLMLHRSTSVNGSEKMQPVKSVAVPAHGKVIFSPGSYHLMCMQPGAGMHKGARVPVTLRFADGKSVTAQFPVHGPGD